MKKIFWLITAILCTTALWISCSKKDANSNPSGKAKLNPEQVKYLEKKYQGLKIDEKALNGTGLEAFGSPSEIEDTIQKLHAYVEELFSIPNGELIVMDAPDPLNPTTNPGGACSYGSKIAYPGKAGMLSSFQLSFQYGADGISNVSFSVSGIQLGWTFNDAGTHKNSQMSACTQGNASFVGGILNWNAKVHINWTFDPATCKVEATIGDGYCGESVPSGGDDSTNVPDTGGGGGPSGNAYNTHIPLAYYQADRVFYNQVKNGLINYLTVTRGVSVLEANSLIEAVYSGGVNYDPSIPGQAYVIIDLYGSYVDDYFRYVYK